MSADHFPSDPAHFPTWIEPEHAAHARALLRALDAAEAPPEPVSETATCPDCMGDGYQVDPRHDYYCIGDRCVPECPVPVQVPCGACGARGYVEAWDPAELAMSEEAGR